MVRIGLFVLATLLLASLWLSRRAPESPLPSAITSAGADVIGTLAWTIKPFRPGLLDVEAAAPDLSRPVEVPFALLRAEGAVGSVQFDSQTRHASLRLDSGATLAFAMEGIPVAMQHVGGGRYVIAFRGMPRNDLWMIEWQPANGGTTSFRVERTGVDYVLFRGGHFDGQWLHWVIYDNRSAKNYLRRYGLFAGRWRQEGDDLELPSLEDPAGTHYEMEPGLSLFGGAERLWIVGGTLEARVEGRQVRSRRFPECERVLEAVPTSKGVAVLCNRKVVDDRGVYVILSPGAAPQFIAPDRGVPWRLAWDAIQGRAEVQLARDARAYAELLEHDLSRAQNSGMLDFGSDNIEGRVAWSQIYYLNGLMDALYLARRDDHAYEVFVPLARRLRLRLELEIRLLDRLLGEEYGLRTRAFTHDRSLALFAVQSSRLLLLFDRYRAQFPDASPLSHHEALRRQVSGLQGHIEVLAQAGETEKWLPRGQHHLRWPRGSAFYFDGLAVPYNHQNEWAYAAFESARAQGLNRRDTNLEPQREIIRHFIRHLAPAQSFPAARDWHYWWGHAYDGYGPDAGRSVHTPEYAGDRSAAWISFRTIDLMSVLAGLDFMPELDATKLRESARRKIQGGEVYPFAARALADAGMKPGLTRAVAIKYARAGSPWEFANQPWALAMLPAGAEEEDVHSEHLNAVVLNRYPAISQVPPGTPAAATALLDYLAMALPYNTGQMLKHAGNELGGKFLAWNLAYDLRAALLGYEHTRDPRYLHLFETAADAVLRVRDNRLGKVDDLRRRPAKAWGSNRYSDGKRQWIAWDAFAGMAAYPLARYCTLAATSRPAAAARCADYRTAAEDALAEYAPYWREDPKSGGGYYLDPYLNDVAPLNHMLSLGLVHLELQRLPGAARHRDRAEKLARFFRHHWKWGADGGVEWEYWAGARQEGHRSSAPEDVTHAQINLHFAFECHGQKIVFSERDMQGLAKTLGNRIMRDGRDWAENIGGGGALIASGLHEGLAGWAVMDRFQPGLRAKMHAFMRNNPRAFPLGPFSYATGPIATALSLQEMRP